MSSLGCIRFGGNKSTGWGRESGGDAWKQVSRRLVRRGSNVCLIIFISSCTVFAMEQLHDQPWKRVRCLDLGGSQVSRLIKTVLFLRQSAAQPGNQV
jgi:hypothetical protein